MYIYNLIVNKKLCTHILKIVYFGEDCIGVNLLTGVDKLVLRQKSVFGILNTVYLSNLTSKLKYLHIRKV